MSSGAASPIIPAGSSRNTLLAYGRDLTDFGDWLEGRGLTVEGIGREGIETYLLYCEAQGLAKSSRPSPLQLMK